GISPMKFRWWLYDGSGGRRTLENKRQRIRLKRQHITGRPHDLIFVTFAGRESRDEYLPHAGGMAQPHGMAPSIPGIEITDDRNALRIRRPHSELHARHGVDHR